MKPVSRTSLLVVAGVMAVFCAHPARGQTSSLYHKEFQAQEQIRYDALEAGSGLRDDDNVSKTIENTSLIAVKLPPPREFRVHDRIMIIVQESKRYRTESDLEETKEWDIDAKLQEWFRFYPRQRLGSDRFPNGEPGVKLNFDTELQNETEHQRRDRLELRIAAEVIDVKPNGNLTLMATKRIKNDEEVQNMALTGTCSSQDVTAEGSVLSTQVMNLQLDIQHTGAIRDGTRRGWIPRMFDFLRPF